MLIEQRKYDFTSTLTLEGVCRPSTSPTERALLWAAGLFLNRRIVVEDPRFKSPDLAENGIEIVSDKLGVIVLETLMQNKTALYVVARYKTGELYLPEYYGKEEIEAVVGPTNVPVWRQRIASSLLQLAAFSVDVGESISFDQANKE